MVKVNKGHSFIISVFQALLLLGAMLVFGLDPSLGCLALGTAVVVSIILAAIAYGLKQKLWQCRQCGAVIHRG